MFTTKTMIEKLSRRLAGGTAVACCLLASAPAQAALTFSFIFEGEFMDPVRALERQAVIDSGNLFSNMFAGHFSNTGALTFTVNRGGGSAAAGSAVIAAAGFGNGEVVRNKILNGTDLNGAAPDGFIFIDLSANFQYAPNAVVNFAGGQLDFFSVMNHELTHALGFGSNIDRDGLTPTSYTKWDQFLTTKLGVAVVKPDGNVDVDAYRDAQMEGGLFNGAKAALAWGSPVPLVKDVDISHLDTATFSSGAGGSVPQNALMLCCGGANDPFAPRDYNAAEIGILADLGYTQAAAVPEPSTYALTLAGLGLFGFFVKRRKSQPVA